MTYLVYKKVLAKEKADEIAHLLNANGIDYLVTEHNADLTYLYGDSHFKQQFFIKIKQEDFARANAALLQATENDVATYHNKEHYLYDFTDNELFDILSKPDEWNEFDYLLSKKILKERGIEINTGTIERIHKQRLEVLAKPDKNDHSWIYVGYILALAGGLFGIFIGWHLNTFKKTLPDGQRVYSYSATDRKHGKLMLTIGIVALLALLVYNLYINNA